MNILTVFQQGDAVLIAVFLLLILMSVLTWYLILVRGAQTWRLRRANREAEGALWSAADWTHAEASLQNRQGQFANLARAGLAALQQYQSQAGRALGQACGVDEFLTRAIRKALAQENAHQETGLTALASIGATAPFVGLFGTVWGIYHALMNIGQAGQMSIAAVAGPIGEALVATAAGLAAAIPAVLAYNALTRAQRVMSQELDYFAHDLHAQLLTQSGDSHGLR
ncbi:MotA/TolQ/ExbB proton channel family protein [Chromobacterium alticapitis]|uniref:Biopolymer transport protein ExbB n=1 Tax=Chromobacterium alticapitis TaxID=2073169 RepID=A0A2S5DKP6_9NEIS|nr:MotA/TolQ/ExbB proton channel family protein [Chromobacterium alticapitis]POZ63627.1 biopolymer transporter ExbB [Chromobacterium alticapitis]